MPSMALLALHGIAGPAGRDGKIIARKLWETMKRLHRRGEYGLILRNHCREAVFAAEKTHPRETTAVWERVDCRAWGLGRRKACRSRRPRWLWKSSGSRNAGCRSCQPPSMPSGGSNARRAAVGRRTGMQAKASFWAAWTGCTEKYRRGRERRAGASSFFHIGNAVIPVSSAEKPSRGPEGWIHTGPESLYHLEAGFCYPAAILQGERTGDTNEQRVKLACLLCSWCQVLVPSPLSAKSGALLLIPGVCLFLVVINMAFYFFDPGFLNTSLKAFKLFLISGQAYF